MTNNNSYQSDVDPIIFLNVLFITIVLYLHHSGYTDNYFTLLSNYKINEILQKFAVGGFFFFSGYKLTISNLSTPVIIFWVKRFFRIYILYFFALLLAVFTYYPYFNDGNTPEFKNILAHIFLLQTIFPNIFGPTILTIWFVSVLFFCYIFFTLTRGYVSNIRLFTFLSIFAFTLISLIYLATTDHNINIFTRDFSIYLLFFSLGMVHSKHSILSSFSNRILLSFSIIMSLLLLLMYNMIYINTLYEYFVYSVLVITGNVFLYVVLFDAIIKAKRVELNNIFIINCSYASFCVFLFHRSIWSVMAMVYPKGTFTQWFCIIIIGVPLIILISLFTQKVYQKTINRAQQFVSRRLAEARR